MKYAYGFPKLLNATKSSGAMVTLGMEDSSGESRFSFTATTGKFDERSQIGYGSS